jgi:hypothetical protein
MTVSDLRNICCAPPRAATIVCRGFGFDAPTLIDAVKTQPNGAYRKPDVCHHIWMMRFERCSADALDL